ncbi:MAG: hypothetical protein ABFE08_17835 [Armatimonadia bacterium]
MVAYTDSLGINKGAVALAGSYTNRLSVIEYDIDFRAIAAARTAAGATALAATDTLVLATLPKGTYIVGGSVRVIRAEGAAGTIDLGITGTLTLFGDDINCNAAAGTMTGTTTAAFLTADTALVMTVNSNSMDVARVLLRVLAVDMGTNPGSIPNVT